jgi:hypothetical protein
MDDHHRITGLADRVESAYLEWQAREAYAEYLRQAPYPEYGLPEYLAGWLAGWRAKTIQSWTVNPAAPAVAKVITNMEQAGTEFRLISQIAYAAEVSRPTVETALARLEAAGVLAVEAAGSRRRRYRYTGKPDGQR